MDDDDSTEIFDAPVLRVGRYRVLSELGRGGMSNVYLAVAQGPGGVNKLVVLKALAHALSAEAYAVSMFLDEARLAAQLNHPNVVQTYEVGTEGDRHVIVMEYLEGQSLAAVLTRGEQAGAPLPLELHLRVIASVLEGLHYAHELHAYNGVALELVHRDVSPQNVFVSYEGQVKVLDFGIAKAATSSTQTATGVMKGKLAYMAPEHIVAESVDRRADVYAVGCMLWAAATGRSLWKDTPDAQIMRRVINGEVPSPLSVNPHCDGDLDRMVMRALATEPSTRYRTALELQLDVEAYCDRLGRNANQRDLARHISALFEDRRAELKALVERQLELASTDEPSASGPRASPGAAAAKRSDTTKIWTQLEGTRNERRAKRLRLALPGLLLLGAVLEVKTLGRELVGTDRPHGTLPLHREPRLSPASPVVPTEPIVAAPTAAHLSEDQPPAPNPAPNGAPREGVRRSAQKRRSVELGATRPSAAKSTPVPTSKVPNCEPPFFVANDGIKVMRPECL